VKDSYRFDVAFSFLSRDLAVAEQLADLLRPGLEVFLYSRQQENLLGSDGMTKFAAVFGRDARIAVILHRGNTEAAPGWGFTPWTGFEESHIKAHALRRRMGSFMLIKFDDAPPPEWVPEFYIYADWRVDSPESIAGAIRSKAREQGAVVRVETAVDVARRQARESAARRNREDRARSYDAVAEVHAEIETLFLEIRHLVEELRTGDPPIDIAFGAHLTRGTIVSRVSTSIVWQERVSNNITGSLLRVAEWDDRIEPPSSRNPFGSGGTRFRSASHFEPLLSEADEWVWRFKFINDEDSPIAVLWTTDTIYRTPELADYIVRSHCERIYSAS
jgi:hypothetical protein